MKQRENKTTNDKSHFEKYKPNISKQKDSERNTSIEFTGNSQTPLIYYFFFFDVSIILLKLLKNSGKS